MKKGRVFKIVILCLIVGFLYFGSNFLKKVDNSAPTVVYDPVKEVETIETVEDTSTKCQFKDSLEYIYYKDTDVLWEQNNKFGLYVYAENKDYIELAQNLVNSNGGEWGYVLIPYNVKDRDYSKWSRVFSQVISKQLIPIIQLWDVDLDDYKKQTEDAAEFLNDFVWPIKYRYISVYNEPNDSKFWYDNADPKEYAKVLDNTISIFKKVNEDYFMMNGALNISAPSDDVHYDAFEFMRLMNEEVPGIFDRLDGWASHPYPQPNFSGSPYVSGRWSIKGYESELNYLKDYLDAKKDLPVFITETGWAHAEGENYNPSYLSAETVASYYEYAYKEVWLKDDRVRAVTPFTIWYNPPFDHFSWINQDKVPFKQFDVVKSMDKVKGEHPHLETGDAQVTECE